jgi:hypothetical protein
MPGSSPTRSCAGAAYGRHMAGQTGLISEIEKAARR